ncbi:3-oxoacyl-ACP reductase FabG [Halochromatium salexigens]|uniref:3-oxoacyl-[acyl-carrier-protein] reductase n=1 Tax=Halochromatium salexigens TaxID=49447 RepID=A0AAJ0XFC0_HALSE|nr:3-oxoacyl-ACP reductase FabG [Halochromatium salexigens]MBK5929552.1 3-oxoacyl-ACP reductase [Halochromatium salexigens]
MLDAEIALVTGASRGIGAAIASELSRLGAKVAGTATTEGGASRIAARFADADSAGIGLCLDVTQPTSIEAALTAVEEQLGGRPTILVNNAGITRDNLLMRMKEQEWDEILDTNLSSVFRLCKACMRSMTKARHGRIINISSVVGVSGNAGQCNYAAAKAGLIGFSKSLAREIGPRGVTVNVVAPGFIDTDMTRELPEAQREALLGSIPLGRLGAPEEIAAAVAFLASPAAAYVTGQTIHVNGGMLMI